MESPARPCTPLGPEVSRQDLEQRLMSGTLCHHEAVMTTTSNVFAMNYGCKTADGRHIYGTNGRCLVCWRVNDGANQASRVLVIVISAESSQCERVEQLTEIVEAQVRGVFKTVELIENGNARITEPTKAVEMEVHVS
jgi:hypothetical protein